MDLLITWTFSLLSGAHTTSKILQLIHPNSPGQTLKDREERKTNWQKGEKWPCKDGRQLYASCTADRPESGERWSGCWSGCCWRWGWSCHWTLAWRCAWHRPSSGWYHKCPTVAADRFPWLSRSVSYWKRNTANVNMAQMLTGQTTFTIYSLAPFI